jgi:uncharacterized membrane protein YeiH
VTGWLPALHALPLFRSSWDGFTIVDLVAASTNALNGALLARRPDHYKHYTVVGILLMAIIGGIGGGVARDVVLDRVPGAFLNPWYIVLCTVAGVIGLVVADTTGQKFREGVFGLMTAFSLPWYAVVGADAALHARLPLIAAVVIGVIGPTAGRYFIDLTSGVTPKQFVRGEWFVGTAVLASVLYIIFSYIGLAIWPATLLTVVIAFAFRLAAQSLRWEEPEPWEPAAVQKGEAPRKSLGEAIHEEFKKQ